jgi:DNA-binding transcriptional LysR family regulator
MILNLERVLRFVAVAEQLSFTRAAALLRIDQPWLSRQIMQLEDQLGVALFDRNGSRISLTPEGAEFFKYAKELREAAERAGQKAEEMKRRTMSTLRLGVCNASHPIEGRKRLIARYHTARPKVSIEYFASRYSDEVVHKVLSGGLDFGIVFGPIDEPNLQVNVIDAIEASLAIPAEDPLAAAPSVRLEDLKERRVAVGLQDRCSPQYARAYAWIDQVGATPVFVPEGPRYVFDAAIAERLFVTCYTPVDKAPEGFVQRALKGPHPKFDVCLIRGKRVMSSAAEYLWRLSQEMRADLDAAAHADDRVKERVTKPAPAKPTKQRGQRPAPDGLALNRARPS